jgi:uncharacterized protein (TIGR02001 family)
VPRWTFLSVGLLAAAFLVPPARAQVSFDASIVSDYRYRGISLSQGKPAGQLAVSYDHDSGLYGGIFGSNVQFDPQSNSQLQLTGYAGYAHSLTDRLSVDAGASYTNYSGGAGYNYVEWQMGVSSESVSARVYFAPNYFGLDLHTLYGELSGSRRINDRLRLIARAGLLKILNSDSKAHARWDGLVGIELAAKPLRFQFGRVLTDGSGPTYPHSGDVWIVRASAAF